MTAGEIESSVAEAGLNPLAPGVSAKFAQYLELLLKWNAKLNLTAIRTPEDIVRRHFLECIQCAQLIPPVASLLDFGSGAGFPGIPVALLRPEISVTLGESQAKKAAFLREATRSLGLSASIFDGRIEAMPPSQQFEVVTLRAVDKMTAAYAAAFERVAPGGWLIVFATSGTAERDTAYFAPIAWEAPVPMTGMSDAFLLLGRKSE
ncbi:16S rRNA (guanine(527)-N(7))-methyltransferase RsmG [Silvibacterium bohemicum]|uniref:16S rRNA (guanine(527)-N(7))-methyltransferase RsmG n=1 Tax=Silvibacterium bohemicum TaxID=1577686 RepID=UPI000679829D|nr:16S rRNA (guanine(527)-N(7))-methyltransferase RsmG [Silvibacterium bohemicum]